MDFPDGVLNVTRMSFSSESKGFPVVLRSNEVDVEPYHVVLAALGDMRKRARSVIAVMVFIPNFYSL